MTSFIFKKRHEQANAANVQMTEAEAALAQSDFNIDKITEIQNKFTGGAVLCVPGRIFIREGTLWKVCRKGPKKRQFFLFNDIMVYGSLVANRYSNQHILPLSHMSVSAECHYQPKVQASFSFDGEHLDEQLDVANAFQISHSNKSFHVFALSSADKSNWLSNLDKHITRVAQSANRSKASARAVWVPDSMTKECMICNQRFTPFVRKHHCRQCGRILCSNCSPHRVNIGKAAAGEAKLERVCKECFKGMFRPLQQQQANDDADGSEPRDLTSPPPASVAAKLVSSVLRSHGNKLQEKDGGDSTDTEDTDDSEDERKEHVPLRAATVVGKPAAPSTEIKRSKSDVTRTRVKPVEERPSSANLEQPPTDEPHPTPPPRKKKLMKMKQQKQEQSPPVAEKVTKATNSTDPESIRIELPPVTDKQTDTQQESPKDDLQPPATASAQETEGSPKDGDTRHTASDREPIPTDGGDFPKGSQSPKRPRRKKKYIKPEEQHGELGTEEVPIEQPSADADRGQETEEPPLEDTIKPGEAQPREQSESRPGEAQQSESRPGEAQQSESRPGPKRPRGRKHKFKAPEAD